ncbi:pseudouridine synthase [Cellvibrio zantedeschiae]|uniref:Pseudouridine synthase n=1 Tax=Cellvibrio zantedeschiae TaxID=1237077 RepID=A0ABQ3ARB9_9GAMM|nr:pseudouridine synthase [Cellvibrio zantedeschiae]GGY64803.1 pseudouridine synthase [Cellvibrio zantedeschiae]
MSDAFDDLAILPPCREELVILKRDSEYLLVNKPTRLLSVPGRHPQNRDSVIARLLEDHPNAAIVHRLDFDTSGIMVVPLNKAALSHISKQFQARTTHKTYIAVVDGLVAQDSGVIDLPIAPDMENRPKYKICTAIGRQSVTEFTVVSRDEIAQTTRLLLHPITGRSHQLRLHMQAIGHPILGCEFYADQAARKKSPRLLLHATELAFDHPVTGERVEGVCKPVF